MSTVQFIRKIDSLLSGVYSSIPFTYYGIVKSVIGRGNNQTLLDCGTGDGSFMAFLNSDKQFRVTGVDVFEPYLKLAKKTGVYDKLIRQDLRKLDIKDKSYDIVFCSHVIEHLSKTEGTKLVKKLEKIAKKRVILLMPVGFFPQEEYDDNEHQEHVSEWYPEDFKKMGYKVRGQGLKAIYKNENIVEKYGLFSYFWHITSTLSQPILLLKPNWSTYMICYKDAKK